MAVSGARVTIEMCLAGRDLTEPRPSPDGCWVAFVVRFGSTSAIVAVPAGGGAERIVTTSPEPAAGRGMGGGCFEWLPDGSALVYAGRDGNLWLQAVAGPELRRLSDVADGRRVEAPVITPDGTSVVAVVDQAEVWVWPLVEATHRASPSRSPGRLDDGSADFVFDPHVTSCGTTVLWQAWNVPDMPWDASRVQRVTFNGSVRDEFRPLAAIQQVGTLPDGRGIGVRDDTGWNNVWVDDAPLVDERFEHAGPTWGMRQRSYAVSPDATRVAFARNERGFGRLCVADLTGAGRVVEVARGVHGQLAWVGDRLTALRTGARTPTEIVAYDTRTWQRTTLAVGPVAGWEGVELPEPQCVEVEARDPNTGHVVVVPARRYPAGQGRVLCWIHGGPTDQWQVEFMPRFAYWWSRGWDVLVPDPRGSTGHGRAHQQALRGEWGRADVDDTAAVLRHAHAAGWSSPATTVMLGSSSGGLTALGVLGRHPGLAAGAMLLYPVTDLAALAAATHRFEAHYTVGLVGPFDDAARYREHSPVSYADHIDAPILIVHGDSDDVVPLASSVAFSERVRAGGGDVELVVMAGEGHGLRDPANRRAEYELLDGFLRRIVGDTG